MENTERELELINQVKELTSVLREIAGYYVHENHPDFTLLMDTIEQSEKILEK